MRLARRHLIGSLGAVAMLLPWRVSGPFAQPRAMLRVGQVSLLKVTDEIIARFVASMAELGYVEGRNFVFDFITVERPADYEAAYVDLIKRGANILLATGGEPTLQAARMASANRVPVVFIAVDYNPVQSGYATSSARPGGNLTGMFVRPVETAAKRIELVRELLPKAQRLGLWWDTNSREQGEAAAAAAKTLELEANLVSVSGQPPDYDAAFRLSARLRVDAVVVMVTPVYFQARAEIVRLALAHHVPLIAAFREFAAEGALMSYGNDLSGVMRETAVYVDRIARGTKPADLPIEQPTKFELAVNLKTAKALGITVPPTLLFRANQVIK
ncbi:MAG: ABC transporter substrate-binding protein [Reyranellales bacterium]